jgi:cell division protein FtsB
MENLKLENEKLKEEIERLKAGIRWWLTFRMKGYTDKQYGIDKMKELVK